MMCGSPHCTSYSYADRELEARSFIDFIERPGAGYPRSEGSGAKFGVY